MVSHEKLLGERGAHPSSALHRGGTEVRLPHLSPAGGLVYVKLRHCRSTKEGGGRNVSNAISRQGGEEGRRIQRQPPPQRAVLLFLCDSDGWIYRLRCAGWNGKSIRSWCGGNRFRRLGLLLSSSSACGCGWQREMGVPTKLRTLPQPPLPHQRLKYETALVATKTNPPHIPPFWEGTDGYTQKKGTVTFLQPKRGEKRGERDGEVLSVHL